MSDNRPEDRCPYPRPFDWEFSECVAFMPRLHLATDLRGNELQAHWTCAHLETGRRESGAFYPACVLGGPAERQRWAAVMKDGQLAAIRLARVELSQHIRPRLEAVRNAVGGDRNPFDSRRREQVRAAWGGLVEGFDEFVEAHPERFEAAGIEPAQIRRCFAEAMAEFAGRPAGREWRMAESVVGRYPWPIVAFFRPDLVRDRALAEAGSE